jgi:hypothetical protein
VRSELRAQLVPAGFERAGSMFIRRQPDEIVAQVEVAGYRWNVSPLRQFEVILGVYAGDGSGVAFAPKSWHPKFTLLIHRNVGALLDGKGRWFELPPDLPDEGLSSELRRCIEDSVLPFFARCNGLEATIATVASAFERSDGVKYPITSAIALAKRGRKEESREYFRRSPGDPDMIRKMAALYGISLDD